MSALWLFMYLPYNYIRLSSVAGVLATLIVGFAPFYMGRGPSHHFSYVTDQAIDITDQNVR